MEAGNYFEEHVWSKMPEYERNRHQNQVELFLELKNKGIEIREPEFIRMKRRAAAGTGATTRARARDILPRKARNVNLCYAEENAVNEDEYLFCDRCDREFLGACQTHGPLQFVADRQLPAGYDGEDRARRTTPLVLALAESGIADAGLGVWTRVSLPVGVVFGPYQGRLKAIKGDGADEPSGYGWTIKRGKKIVGEVDATESKNSNWLRFVNCPTSLADQNVVPFQYRQNVYYRTVKEVPAGTELLVYYGDDYAKKLGIDTGAFHRGDATPTPPAVFACAFCEVIGFTDPVRRDRHEKSTCRERRFADLQPTTALPFADCVAATCPEPAFEASATLNEPSGASRKRHQCGECSFSSGKRSTVERHASTHSGERPHACTRCEFACARKDNLKRHEEAVHGSGVRSHACPECEYRGGRKEHLAVHVRSVHRREKPYKCESCEYSSAQEGHLRLHVRAVHQTQEPKLGEYACSRCAYKTVQSCHLTRHVARVHDA